MGSRDEGGGKVTQTSSDLYFNMKDHELSLYTFVKFVEDQMDSLPDCLDGCGDGIVTAMKALVECLFRARHCETYVKGRVSITNDNLTIQ